jgi:hypothetical protein
MAYHPLRAPVNSGVMGVVYLLHFSAPVGHAQHYRGWYANRARLRHHEDGTGARLCQVALERGISWQVVLEIPGDRNLERLLKNRGSARRDCPVCRGEQNGNP